MNKIKELRKEKNITVAPCKTVEVKNPHHLLMQYLD